jgi:LPS-assembly lipoprotein
MKPESVRREALDQPVSMHRRTLLCALASGALAACGFRPAGSVTVPFETLYVAAPDYSSFGAEFKRYMESGGKTRLADSPGNADAVLEILNEQQEKVVLSLSSAGRVREYLLRYRVAFRLLDPAKRVLIPPSEISLQRDLTYDDSAVLGKENEEVLLYRDMKNDAVQQLLRRLAAAPVSA